MLRLSATSAVISESTPVEWKEWHCQQIPFRNLILETEQMGDTTNSDSKEELLEIFCAATQQAKGSGRFDYLVNFNSGPRDAAENRTAGFSGTFAVHAFLDWLRTDLWKKTERQLPTILAPVAFSRSVVTPASSVVHKLDGKRSGLELRGLFPTAAVVDIAESLSQDSRDLEISLTPLTGSFAVLNAFNPVKAKGPLISLVRKAGEWKLSFNRNSGR